MTFEQTILAGAYLITPRPMRDDRGFFSRWFCEDEFGKHGLEQSFVQCNHSQTIVQNTVRGMHFQYPPHAEVKLVKCISGVIFDVIVDLRAESPSFLKWFGAYLSAENMNMLYIPKGFAHGFQSVSPSSEIIYMVSAPYHKESEGGVHYADPAVGIQWPNPVSKVSMKDQAIPFIDRNTFKGLQL